jgi:hypothetical protein
VNDTLKRNTETVAKNIGRKYPTKQIDNNNNNNNNNNNDDDDDDVPRGTKDKVYSAVLSPYYYYLFKLQMGFYPVAVVLQ